MVVDGALPFPFLKYVHHKIDDILGVCRYIDIAPDAEYSPLLIDKECPADWIHLIRRVTLQQIELVTNYGPLISK